MPEPALSPALNPPPSASNTSSLLSWSLCFFRTLPNSFRLSCQYYGVGLPTHDPEEVTTLENLTLTHSDQGSWDLVVCAAVVQHKEGKDTFYLYPNKLSFLLGDWFWNGGLQKSQKSLKELLQILGDPEFWQEDVLDTCWNLINHQLGSSAEDAGGQAPLEGAGWKKTAINIKIPVHNHADNPGIYDYLTTDLHH
jgi:hypothetical protein